MSAGDARCASRMVASYCAFVSSDFLHSALCSYNIEFMHSRIIRTIQHSAW